MNNTQIFSLAVLIGSVISATIGALLGEHSIRELSSYGIVVGLVACVVTA